MSRGARKRVIPLIEERATVVKSEKTQGGVRLNKRVREQEARVEEPLHATEYDIRRVPRDLWIDEAVPMRSEGATTIYPVVHEIAFVVKRLKLVEEVHVTPRQRVQRFTDSVALKREEITIERVETEHNTDDNADPEENG